MTKPEPTIDFEDLFDLLGGVNRPGTFCVSGEMETSVPNLQIEGVGQLSFPLPPEQARRIIEVAERAPYGRGGETLVDTSVRRTWQIAPEHIRLDEKRWGRTLRAIVERTTAGLGCGGEPVRAELYKALLYDQGSFFVEHRDTEKAKGMFATLVVVLPSPFRGGELVVKHNGQEVCLALSGQDVAQVSYGAFYADCLHELRPVTEGYRLCLIYNLIRGKGTPPPAPPDYRAEIQAAAAFLNTWGRSLDALERSVDSAPPRKLLYVLEHRYTPENLSFAGLKNGDAAVASVLRSAATEARCDLWLAMISIKESGPADAVDHRHRRYGEDDADADFEVIEVSERTQTVERWVAPDDSEMGLRELPFDERELCPPDALEDEEPDEKLFTEATGNEGGSFERTYRRAALVLWPRRRRVDVLLQAEPLDVLPFLQQRTEALARATPVDEDVEETLALADGLIGRWPRHPTDQSYQADQTDGARMLASLARLQDARPLRRFVSDLVTVRYNGQENAGLVEACRRLGWEVFGPLLSTLVERHRRAWFVRCAELLGLLHPLAQAPEALQAWRAASQALVAGLPESSKSAPPDAAEPWVEEEDSDDISENPKAGAAMVVASLSLFWAANEPVLARQVAEHALANGALYPPDRQLLPALATLFAQRGREALTLAGFEPLRQRVVSFLEERIARPLSAPRDWQREAKISCRCGDCAALGVFLKDAKAPQWSLKAAKDRRTHVERQILRDGCDLDCKTEYRGSPHTLVCTKNQRSYERLCAQRKSDLAGLAQAQKMAS